MSGTIRAARPPGMARLAAAAFVAGLNLGVAGTQASAQQFLIGQSEGMNRCVRAILRGYTVKRVDVHGHHFNCKPLRRLEDGRRVISISNNRRLRHDHWFSVSFRVNRVGEREYIRNNSARFGILRSIDLIDFVPPFEFTGPPGRTSGARDYDFYVRRAREIRPREQRSWEVVAKQIATIVIATLGEPWP